MKSGKKLVISLLCGGPSLERGISLNSARSVLDHLEGEDIDILPVYFDYKKRPFRISQSQLYSNTPSDFDFKLKYTATPLDDKALIRLLRRADIAFPVMHGPFGEDGGIQRILEKNDIPFIGSAADSCKLLFDKYDANEWIRAHGFHALPSVALKIYRRDHKNIIDAFFKKHRISRAVVKPASGGSSIGVFSVQTPTQALDRVRHLFSRRFDTRVVIEPFAMGREFTVIILENRFNLPVAIIPTEIEADYAHHQIFDFRKKYLPTRQVTYHCPPRFSDETIDRIQVQAEQLFTLFRMRDFARFDGWALEDGNIWFSDFNPVSGMEQNSFLFQQASRIGLSHRGVLRHVVGHACQRYNIIFPSSLDAEQKKRRRKPVHVLFGGSTSERQVSLMSGTNVWLKLKHSHKYCPEPFIVDARQRVWKLPYTYTLNHTVEEIKDNCVHAAQDHARLSHFERRARLRLGLPAHGAEELRFIPKPITLHEFIKKAPFVFIALHGGWGEDGTLQAMLDKAGIPYNGSGTGVSSLCMDKWRTDRAIEARALPGIHTIATKLVKSNALPVTERAAAAFWKTLTRELHSRTLVIKPRADGCSAGVARLFGAGDLTRYLGAVRAKASSIPAHTLKLQNSIIEMPRQSIKELLFQSFIETDTVRVARQTLKYRRVSGWIEVTIGLREHRGIYRIFNPSLTVAEGEVLTVEEKFQGGTGVNITPPPPSIVRPIALARARHHVEKLARAMDMRGYARIDAFLHVDSGSLLIIEINTLPALTPSTVLFHQALSMHPSLSPREFIEKIIENAGY